MNQPYIEEVVLQDAWLRRVARALVRDAHGAEDLAQDAWVAGLGRGRTRVQDRSWLGGVLRHRAFSDRRKASSRLDREQQTARREPTPATDEVAAQLQLRELVSRELRGLDEPFRTAVYLHFVEGLSLRQVAERLDVAASTAHARVDRGIDQLRQRLDGAHGGDRRVWVGLLAPWGGAVAPSALWQAGPGMIAAALLGALLTAGGVLWFTRPAPAGAPMNDPLAGLVTPETESGAASGSVVALATIEPASLRAEARSQPAGAAPVTPAVATALATQDGAVLRGTWAKPGGAPASGAAWTLEARTRSPELARTLGEPSDWQDLEGALSSDGALELSFEPHPSQFYTLTLDDPDFVPMTWRFGALGEGEVKDLGDITLRAPGRVEGRLVDPNGAPLGFRTWRIHAKELLVNAGAELMPAGEIAETDIDAAFSFDRLPEGPVQLQLYDRNLGWTRGPIVQVAPGETVVVDFPFTRPPGLDERVLLTCHRLGGALFDSLEPEQFTLVGAEGARIVATRDPALREAYVFEGVGEGEFAVEIDDARMTVFAPSSVQSGQSVQCMVMGSAALQLSVTDPEGLPMEFDSVDLTLRSAGADPRKCTVRNGGSMLKEGRLRALVPGDYDLFVHAGAMVGSVSVAGLLADETRPVAVTLEPLDVVTGQVLRPDGTPAAGEMVRLVTPAPVGDRPGIRVLDGQLKVADPSQYRRQVSVAFTDQEGRYRLPLVSEPALIAIAGDFPGPMAESAAFDGTSGAPPGPMDLLLPEPARFEGKILVPEDTHLTGWGVRFKRFDPGDGSFDVASAVTSGGRFSLGPVAAGEGQLILQIRSGGRFLMGAPGELVPGVHLLDTVTLQAGETATGEYAYPGEPLIQVYLDVAGLGVEAGDYSAHLARYPAGPTGVAAAQGPTIGPFRLEPGVHELRLAGTNWMAKLSDVMVPATDGVTIPVTVELAQRRVRFLVDGSPLVSHRLKVWNEPSSRFAPDFKTDAEGFIDLVLGAGTYQLHPAERGDPMELTLSTATFDWPLPTGQNEITLVPPEPGWTQQELFK